MSNKELAIQLLENVPPNKLGYVISYLQGITADEDADDQYCEALYSQYKADPSKDETISLEAAAKSMGVVL
ncbi:MAG: hypothetical protein RR879_00060 [Hydrogenoanaerobacterium sp.]